MTAASSLGLCRDVIARSPDNGLNHSVTVLSDHNPADGLATTLPSHDQFIPSGRNVEEPVGGKSLAFDHSVNCLSFSQ